MARSPKHRCSERDFKRNSRMDEATRSEFRRQLLDRLAQINALAAANDDARATVELDQQSVGRLSRMDAIQAQSMAQETHRRRVAEAERIRLALIRLDEDEYGWCETCGEEIPLARLRIDATARLCVSCAR